MPLINVIPIMLFRKIMGTDWANIRTTEGSVRKTSRF
jgi:hypothetical protein